MDSEQLWKIRVESIKIEKSSKIHSYSLIFATVIRNSVAKYAAYGLKGRVTVAEYLEQFFMKQVEKKGWTLITIEVRPNHIHLSI